LPQVSSLAELLINSPVVADVHSSVLEEEDDEEDMHIDG